VHAFVESAAKRGILITYLELANALQMLRPIPSIGKGKALEPLSGGARGGAPPLPQPSRRALFIAGLAISKAPSGLQALFDCSSRASAGSTAIPKARTIHAAELCLAGELRATADNEDNMFIETSQTPNVGSGLSRSPPIATASIDVGAAAIQVQERPWRPGNPHRGEGIRVHRHIAPARPSARLHKYGRGGHDPLSLLRDAVPLRSSIDRVRCRPAGQLLC
jgi:hypothetical protein